MSCYGGGEVDDDDDMESNGTCPDCGCETWDGVSVYPACSYSPVICKHVEINLVISPVSILIVYLTGMVIVSALIKFLDVKGSVEFRGWSNEPNLSKIAIIVFLWPIIAVIFISLVLWAGLWDIILPARK